jgi:hypothetical protein
MKMNGFGSFCFLVLGAMTTCAAGQVRTALAQSAATPPKPAVHQVSGAFIPTRVLVQSAVETVTELQIICLFESAPENTLHGSLLEAN